MLASSCSPAKVSGPGLAMSVGTIRVPSMETQRESRGRRKAKSALDVHIRNCGKTVEHWGFHDLRRTVRTHMSRLNVASGIAERVLNHTPQGVEAIYDRHGYLEEKLKALDTWATSVSLILNDEQNDNVVELEVNN